MRLLRIEEVAHRLGLQPSTVRKLIHLGQIPAVRPTKRAVRVREEDVEALVRVGYRPQEGAGSGSGRQQQLPGFALPDEGLDLDATLDQIESRLLTKALERTKGVQTRAADLLRLSFRQLRYRLQKHGLGRAKCPEDTGSGNGSLTPLISRGGEITGHGLT